MTDEAAPAKPTRSEAYRERLRQAQIVASQAARARAAGKKPNDDEATRLVAEFHARGGQVTYCDPAEDTVPVTKPASTKASRTTPAPGVQEREPSATG